MYLSKPVTAFVFALLVEQTAVALPVRDCASLLVGESFHIDEAAGPRNSRMKARRAYLAAVESYDSGQNTDLDRVIALASRYLELEGIRHKVVRTGTKVWVIEIIPDQLNGNRLNRIADSLWMKHGTKVVFDLKKLTDRESKASYRRPDPDDGRDYGVLSLPRGQISHPHALDLSLIHEIVHSHTIRRLARGEQFPFFGRVISTKVGGKPAQALPGSGLVDRAGKLYAKSTYEKYFAFDEIEAYFVQVRSTLHRFRDAAEAKVSKELRTETKLRIYKGLRLSRQGARFARAAIEALQAGTAVPTYMMYEGYSQARLRLTVDGVRLTIKLPLVGSNGPEDPANSTLLSRQLDLLLSASAKRAGQFHEMLIILSPKTAAKFDDMDIRN